jgi:hypothetical protein
MSCTSRLYTKRANAILNELLDVFSFENAAHCRQKTGRLLDVVGWQGQAENGMC